VIYDPELPFGEVATYSTLQQPASVSDPVTVDSDSAVAGHPGLPILSRPIVLRAGSFGRGSGRLSPGCSTRRTGHRDRRHRRPAEEAGVVVHRLHGDREEFEQIEALIDDAGILLLNVPKHLGLLIPSAYINVLDIDEDRRSDIGEDPRGTG
jgi:hypothetical protein